MANPPDKDKLFDYSLVKKIYADVKASGWRPTPWRIGKNIGCLATNSARTKRRHVC